MKKYIIGSSLMAVLACTGCALFQPAVPTTTLLFNAPDGSKASFVCPKQFEATNLVFVVGTNKTVTLKVGSVKSENDPNVLSAGFSGQAALIKSVSDAAHQAFQDGLTAAGTVGGAAVKAP